MNREEMKNRFEEMKQKKEEWYNGLDTDGKLLFSVTELGQRACFAIDKNGGQKRALILLLENGEMGQRELGMKLGIQPGSLSELLHKLEGAQLIRRSVSGEDRRNMTVSLTEDGTLLAENAKEKREAEKKSMFEALTSEEKETFLALLEKLNGDWKEKYPAHRRPEHAHHCPPHGCHEPEGPHHHGEHMPPEGPHHRGEHIPPEGPHDHRGPHRPHHLPDDARVDFI